VEWRTRKPGVVAHTCNPSSLGGLDGENPDSRSAWGNSSQDPLSKITRAAWTGGEAQAVECLLCKCKVLSSKPHSHRKGKKRRKLRRH
jgi:hypothetical protein